MKRIIFHELGDNMEILVAGEVHLLDDGSLKFSDEAFHNRLETQPVLQWLPDGGKRLLRPSDEDKEAWFTALPIQFNGSHFCASDIIEE